MDITQIFNQIDLPSSSYFEDVLFTLYPYASIVFWSYTVLAGTLIAIELTLQILNLRKPKTLLEITPPRKTEIESIKTEELFSVIHNIGTQKSFIENFFGIEKNLSFEIVSTKALGIRYLIHIDSELKNSIKKSLLSYLPGTKITEIENYNTTGYISELKLNKHFAFPININSKLNKTDPISYLTGAMTKLEENELISLQIVTQPINKNRISDVRRIFKLIYTKKDLINNINQTNPLKTLLSLMLQIALLPLGLVIFILSSGREGPLLPLTFNKPSKKTTNPYQQELEKVIKNKLEQPLFRADIRILIKSQNNNKNLLRGIYSSLFSATNSNYQNLKPTLKRLNTYKRVMFRDRLLSIHKNNIFSVSELSSLYHFPFSKNNQTEDLVKEHSKELPAPISLKQQQDLDVTFAKNTYGNTETLIGLTEDERRRHMYILGATGTGKSTMLLSMINSDINNGKGLAVLDPHGDLIEQILSSIPEDRINDVVYFNPDDLEYPMGINLLELSKGLSPEDQLREKEFITESIISLFHKIYTEKYSGPRMEYILRNTIHTAFYVPDATLFTVHKLLINTKFQKSITKNIPDENLRDFWKYEFGKAGDYQKVKMISPITNKIGRFLFSPVAKRILEQEKSTIDFDDIMNNKKILLCNLSKGKLGEDTSKVFGIVMMTKIQLAALKRARMTQEERTDFYFYVDEFQNFATPAFAQILSEARKYKLNAILAHQTTSQLEDSSLVNVTLANTGTVICFRTANPEDERVILPQFRPYVEQGEIANLPSYRFYIKLGALNPQEPFSGITVPIDVRKNENVANKVKEKSRKLFAKKYCESQKTEIKENESVKLSKKTIEKNKFQILP